MTMESTLEPTAFNEVKIRIFRRHAIELARLHRKYCPGESCTISLYWIKKMAENSGVVFTEEELMEFL